MDRRNFIKRATLTTAGIAMLDHAKADSILSFIDSKRGIGERPNILFIMTDQHFAEALSCAGSKDVKTPAIDYIAKYGVRFENAYCSSPLSVPSRTSMFSGMQTHQVGAQVNNLKANWDTDKYPSMGNVIKKAGYETGYVGKWHLPISPSEIDRHGFDFIKEALPNELDDRVVKPTREFLFKKRKKPFFLVSSFVNPHDICQWARGDKMKNDPIPYPPKPERCPELPTNFEIPYNEPTILRELQKRSLKTYPTSDWDGDKWRQYRWAYNRLIGEVDAHIQKILDALKESGHEDNTLIIFTSDHGDGYGSHKWNQKQVLYNESIKVPFIVSWKGVIKPGVDKTNIVNVGLDLIPTFCDFAAIKQPDHCKGLSVKNLFDKEKTYKWREFTIIQTEFCQSFRTFNIKGRAVISNKFKYIIYDKGENREQLFDLTVDKGEMNDLSNNNKYKHIIKEYQKVLRSWIIDTNDNFNI